MSLPLRRTLVAVVAVAAVGAGGYAVADSMGLTGSPDGEDAGAATASPTPTPVSTEPPPVEEVATDEHVPSEPSQPSGPATDDDASVVIAYAGWDPDRAAVEVAGFVGDVVEDGGTCTLTLTKGGTTRTDTVSAEADASTTVCPSIRVPGEELPSGTWRAVLSYESESTAGRSDAVDVVVP